MNNTAQHGVNNSLSLRRYDPVSSGWRTYFLVASGRLAWLAALTALASVSVWQFAQAYSLFAPSSASIQAIALTAGAIVAVLWGASMVRDAVLYGKGARPANGDVGEMLDDDLGISLLKRAQLSIWRSRNWIALAAWAAVALAVFSTAVYLSLELSSSTLALPASATAAAAVLSVAVSLAMVGLTLMPRRLGSDAPVLRQHRKVAAVTAAVGAAASVPFVPSLLSLSNETITLLALVAIGVLVVLYAVFLLAAGGLLLPYILPHSKAASAGARGKIVWDKIGMPLLFALTYSLILTLVWAFLGTN